MAEAGRNLAKDGIITLGMRLVNTVLALVLGVITARALGPHMRGLYILPTVDAAIAISMLSGLTTATSYFMLNRKAGRGVLPAAGLTAVLFVAGGSVLVIAMAWIGHSLWAAIPALVALPLSAAINIAAGYAYGVKNVRSANAITLATTMVTLLLMVFGLYAISKSATVAIFAWLISNAVIAVTALAIILWHSRRLDDQPVSFAEYRAFAWKVGLANLISLLNYRIDVYVVATFASATALGLYTLAVSGAESLNVITQVASIVTAPHIGSLNRHDAAELTARAMRSNFILALLTAAVLYLVSTPLITLLYGPAFTPAVFVFRILLIGVIAMSNASISSSFFTLQMGDPNVSLRIAGFGAVICLILSLLLVPRIGIAGAAAASSVAYILATVWMLMTFYRESKIPLRDLFIPNLADLTAYRHLIRRFRYGA